MDGATYSRIPEDNVKQSAKALKFRRRFIFQQGNDLKHTATELEQYFSERMSKNSIIKMCNTDRLTAVILREVIQPASIFEYLNTYTGGQMSENN